MKDNSIVKMAKVKNHDKSEPGGRLVKCSECGTPGLVDEKDAESVIICDRCDSISKTKEKKND